MEKNKQFYGDEYVKKALNLKLYELNHYFKNNPYCKNLEEKFLNNISHINRILQDETLMEEISDLVQEEYFLKKRIISENEVFNNYQKIKVFNDYYKSFDVEKETLKINAICEIFNNIINNQKNDMLDELNESNELNSLFTKEEIELFRVKTFEYNNLFSGQVYLKKREYYQDISLAISRYISYFIYLKLKDFSKSEVDDHLKKMLRLNDDFIISFIPENIRLRHFLFDSYYYKILKNKILYSNFNNLSIEKTLEKSKNDLTIIQAKLNKKMKESQYKIIF